MLRNFVALTGLALTGVMLLAEPSLAGFGGVRGGGVRAGGFRAPVIIHRNARAGLLRQGQSPRAVTLPRHHQIAPAHVRIPPVAQGAFTTTHLFRLNHRAYVNGWVFPVTTYGETGYIGTPYDPAEAIPVYAPYPPAEADPPAQRPPMPRLTNAREDNQDACRSERVTVPATEGEREILVVRC
jgi:hypothetical protein